MAQVDNKGMVRGTAGSVVYRSYREKNIIQGKPRKFKQTQASIKASTEFGLSSSAAAVIRRAFQPAYVHRDGKAVSRSTQLVYRALRNSLSGSVGQRDLHDANLQDLVGLDFNAECPLQEILQLNHRVSRDAEGNVQVELASFCPSRDLRKMRGAPPRATLYRIRLMLVAFDFRREYLEYLDMRDLDVYSGKTLEKQLITLKGTQEPGCMMLLSMSLLLYNGMGQTGEYVLLNNKGFSPGALIGAFEASSPSERTAEPLKLSKEAYPDRFEKIREMGYAGNLLLRDLPIHLRKACDGKSQPDSAKVPGPLLKQTTKLPHRGEKISFKKL